MPKMPGGDSVAFYVLRNPSETDVSKLLAKAGAVGLRGIEDYSGNVFVWPYGYGTHMMFASVLNIPYDASADYVGKLTGKTFYIRSLYDWSHRERCRAEPDSFTSKCRTAALGQEKVKRND